MIDVIGDRDATDQMLMLDDFGRRHQVVEFRECVAGRRARDQNLFGLGRIVEFDQEHEAVELGFGERIRSLLFDRILSG